jgi:hypothetical protein
MYLRLLYVYSWHAFVKRNSVKKKKVHVEKADIGGIPVNPFISITPRKPIMSSGSWLTLHNCGIFYLLAVNYDPATTDLIFIRVNIYPGPGKGALS